MTDGDNTQWLQNDFATSENWWASPYRGRVPIGWTMSPAAAELVPLHLQYVQRTAVAGKDDLVAGPSGVGYVFPDHVPSTAEYAALTARFMAKSYAKQSSIPYIAPLTRRAVNSGLRIVNLLGDGLKWETVDPFLEQAQIDAVIYYWYSLYSHGKGGHMLLRRVTGRGPAVLFTWRRLVLQEPFRAAVRTAARSSLDGRCSGKGLGRRPRSSRSC